MLDLNHFYQQAESGGTVSLDEIIQYISSFEEENLVRYTLWRSCLLEAKGDEKQAKAYFPISTVLFPAIRETQIY